MGKKGRKLMHPDNIGQQFEHHVKVYRGLADITTSQVDYSNIGRHWSSVKDSALEFSDSGNPADKDKPAVLLEGYVHPNHILNPLGRTARGLGAIPGSDENEATIRKGSPVHVVAATEWAFQGRGGFRGEGREVGGRRKEFDAPIVAKANDIFEARRMSK
jgi:hypothetical protein